MIPLTPWQPKNTLPGPSSSNPIIHLSYHSSENPNPNSPKRHEFTHRFWRRPILLSKVHHRDETFQDEFRRVCRKYGVEIDERYVWD